MKCRKFLCAALMVALAPLIGGFTTPAASPVEAQTQTDHDSRPPLSPPAAEVVKMVLAGTPDDAVKAYIENSSSSFDLTPDSTAYLRSIGIPTTVTDAMARHDAALGENPGATPPTSPAEPGTVPPDVNVPPPLATAN